MVHICHSPAWDCKVNKQKKDGKSDMAFYDDSTGQTHCDSVVVHYDDPSPSPAGRKK
jgi:hypothetical protein